MSGSDKTLSEDDRTIEGEKTILAQDKYYYEDYLSCIKLLPRYPDFLSSKISRNKRVPIGVVFLIK